ncbi:MAG: hypothetical protein LUH10_00115 [Tannerellaceae bacterium]|nr:hypothetical protein [Tannerellaceae bacterium]
MFVLDFEISMGSYKLQFVDSVTIRRSVENLADTAEIILPSSSNNRTLEIEDKISIGELVIIRLGYKDEQNELPVEFRGYIQSITTDGGVIKIACEDELYNFRKELANIVLEEVTLEQIVEQVAGEVSDFEVCCDYDFTYDRFTIYDMTGLDVLKKIQEESNANIYFRENTLHVHPHYAEQGQKVIYDFAVNIEQSELTYNENKQRNYLVIVEGTDTDGKVIRVQKGEEGGEKVTIRLEGVSDISSLETRAEEELNMQENAAYEGSITGWLVPYVEPTWLAEIRDEEYPFRDGTYYVVSVDTSFSSKGGVRKVTFGKKIE